MQNIYQPNSIKKKDAGKQMSKAEIAKIVESLFVGREQEYVIGTPEFFKSQQNAHSC